MERFKKILFSPLGTHDNPAAIRRVNELATDNNATLSLLGVVPEPPRLQRVLHRGNYLDRALSAERARVETRLKRCRKAAAEHAETRLAVGDPAVRIIEHVLSAHHDLVVVTTDEDREDRAVIRRLLRECPCPVWVIRPSRARVQRVLAAVNPEPSELGLNRMILELSASLVELHGGELHLAHAWELYGESTMRGSAFMSLPPADVDALVEGARVGHEQALEQLLSDCGLDGQPWQVHLVKGSAAELVPGLVAKHRINLLVMGTVARTGANRMVMGNTAERVLDEVNCSVMAIKPEGFVSPIPLPES